jgi:hypothetical protein
MPHCDRQCLFIRQQLCPVQKLGNYRLVGCGNFLSRQAKPFVFKLLVLRTESARFLMKDSHEA